MFNLHWVSDNIDKIITELSEQSEREPEIEAAVGVLLAAKRLITTYSDRMISEPRKNYKKISPTQLGDAGMWLALKSKIAKPLKIPLESSRDVVTDAMEWVDEEQAKGRFMYPDVAIQELHKINQKFNELFRQIEYFDKLTNEKAKELSAEEQTQQPRRLTQRRA
jgi:hypothetical protein